MRVVSHPGAGEGNGMTPFSRQGMRLGIKSTALVAALLIATTVMAACDGGGNATGGSAKLQAVTSLEIFADMVRNVGGDRVDVKALLPPGADPHTYELPPSRVADVARVRNAREYTGILDSGTMSGERSWAMGGGRTITRPCTVGLIPA